MAPAIDVLRSQQQELTALNQLANAEADFEIQLKRFLITLGVPTDIKADITGLFPEIKPFDPLESVCIENAIKNRLDLQTIRDQYIDAQRELRVSRRSLLPQLNLFGDVIYTGDSDEGYIEQDLEEEVRAGVRLEIPFDQRDERDAIRRSLIGLETARRNVRETEDEIQVGIIENIKRLKVFEITVTIQKKNIEISEKRARNAVLRFKNGELSNRDVVEAENELLTARNAYARALTDYELQRIGLQRDMGMLDVGPKGQLIELTDNRIKMIFNVNSLQKKQDEE
jgi:outer membrane protein